LNFYDFLEKCVCVFQKHQIFGWGGQLLLPLGEKNVLFDIRQLFVMFVVLKNNLHLCGSGCFTLMVK